MPSDDTQNFAVLADALQAAWESGDAIPDLAQILRGSRGLSSGQLLELCLTDQAYRWRTPQPLRVEDYLALCPPIAQDRELLLDLAYGEIRTRQQLGDPPAAEEIEARFPTLAAVLREQLEVSFWMDEGRDHRMPTAPRLPVCVLHPNRSPAVPLSPVCALHHSGRIGPYELGEIIAHGGMGVVFRARHVRLNRIVALKVIRPDRISHEADRRRFQNETVTIAQLDHPHIVPIYDVGEVDGVHYFTMKLMEGGDLQQHCRRWLDDPRAAAGIIADVAGAVHHAHQRGVLHRDVKPSNVLLDQAGRPHITDFGLARRLDDDAQLTDTGDLLGTPAYMAPEHLTPDRGPLTVAADVYGLGAVLYVLLTGRAPFVGEHVVAVLDGIRNREPTPPHQLNPRGDPDLEQVCLKALAKRPADRYAGAQDMADDLQRFLAGEGVRARPLTWRQQRWRWIRRHPDLTVVGAAILFAAFVLVSLLGVQTFRLHGMRRSLDDSLRIARGHQAEADANRREAARLRQSAEEEHKQTDAAREEVVAQRQAVRETAYAAAVHHIEMAWRAGDTTEFSRLLDEQLPPPGQPDVRGFEWFVLDRLHRPRPEPLPVFAGPVRSVCWSPDGRRIAAAGEPGLIQILDAATGRVSAFWPSLTTTRDLAFSPDGTLLAAVGDDGRLRLFPAGGGSPQVWPAASTAVWQVAFVGGGPLLATCDSDGQIQLLDRTQGQVVASLAGSSSEIECLAVAPDGQWLISGDRDGGLKVWDSATRQGVYEFNQGSTAHVMCLAVSADGTLVATGDTDGTVRVARLSRPWAHQWILLGQHFDRLQEVAFSADGSRVAGCDKNGAVRVWRIGSEPSGDASHPLPPEHAWQAHDGRGYAVAFDPHQARLATGGQEGHVAVWSLKGSEQVLRLGEPGRETARGRSLSFTPDSKLVAVAAGDGIQLWDVQSRTLHARLSSRGQPRDHVAVSRDGQYLAAGRDEDRLVEVWRRSAAGYQHLWMAEMQPSEHLAFSPSADALAVVDWEGNEVAVYDTATGRAERRLAANQCWAAEFSPDGQQLAFTDGDDVIVWDWTRRQALRQLQAHRSTVTDLAYSPDGTRLASCGGDRRIEVWDTQTGALLRTMMGHRTAVSQVAFVGNDRLVSLDEDGTILVWHAELGTQLCSLREDRTAYCFRLAISPDQRWLACRLSNGDIPLIDLSRGEPASELADAADGRP